jgi:hypothetical protein
VALLLAKLANATLAWAKILQSGAQNPEFKNAATRNEDFDCLKAAKTSAALCTSAMYRTWFRP